jgi:cell division transport system permease protein
MASARDSEGENVASGAAVLRERALGRNAPLVPVASIAGRALVTVIAIMTFLAALTAGGAQLLADASSGWRSAIAREVTIQVRPVVGGSVDADMERAAAIARAQPGVTDVRLYSKEESERLLEPWLGSGLNLDELPVPRIVVVSISPQQPPDFALFRQQLAQIKGVSLDDHRLWVQRLAAMANTIVALALAIVLLVIAATALAVAFATRGAMAGNREIIAVLHFVGASDDFIAKEFQHHFLRLGLRGGAIGGGAALLFFGAAGALTSHWVATPGGDQLEALFGTFSLGLWGFLAVGAIALLVALVTAVVSRITVHRTLRELG